MEYQLYFRTIISFLIIEINHFQTLKMIEVKAKHLKIIDKKTRKPIFFEDIEEISKTEDVKHSKAARSALGSAWKKLL